MCKCNWFTITHDLHIVYATIDIYGTTLVKNSSLISFFWELSIKVPYIDILPTSYFFLKNRNHSTFHAQIGHKKKNSHISYMIAFVTHDPLVHKLGDEVI
jgi:hypothetical protein